MTTDTALERGSSSNSNEEKRRITVSDLKTIHTESRRIAADNLPENKGILSKLRNRGIEHKRRKLAKDISRVAVDREKVNREEQNRLENEGEIDPLTSIYTRRGFNRRLVAEIARMKREDHAGTVAQGVLLFLDANDFKDINDLKGHDEGDRILQKIATILMEKARPTDIVARVGGDEFALFLSGASTDDAQRLFDERLNPTFITEGINISTGMADFNPYDVDQSKKNTDVALYAAKHAYEKTGGNEIRTFRPGMTMVPKKLN